MPAMKILCIPGGGAHVLAAAHFLTRLESDLGPLHKSFDLICGTSAGAIVGAMVALGTPAVHVQGLFQDNLASIFPPVPWWKPWRGIVTPKYDSSALREAIDLGLQGGQETFQTKFMTNALQVAPIQKPQFWKSWEPQEEALVLDSLMATSAAPGLFAPYRCNGKTYLDGSLSTNDLSACALAEAVRLQGSLQGIKILTVRSTGVKQEAPANQHLWSPLGFVAAYPHLSVAANQSLAEYQAHSLIGFNNHVVDLGMDGPLDKSGLLFGEECYWSAKTEYEIHREELLRRFGVNS